MSDNSTGITLYDVQTLASVCLFFAGNADERWANVPTNQTVSALAQYYTENPIGSPEDVMKMMGWSEDVYSYLDYALGGLNYTAPSMNDLFPLISHPENGNQIPAVFAVFTVLSTIVLALRLWSRLSIAGRIQAFDWCTILAYFLIIAWSALAVVQSNISAFTFSCDLTWTQYHLYEKMYGVLMITYPIVILSIKTALLLFYHQLSAWKPLRIGVYLTGFICFGNAVSSIFTWLFQCPYPNLWDHAVDVNMGICALDQKLIVLASGGISIATDLIIWIIPMPLIYKLQLTTRERLLAVCTFGVGLIACVGSICRILAIKRYIYYGDDSTDSYDSRQPINIWAMVEMNLALICSSVPALRALLVKHAPKILSRSSDASGSTKGSSNFKGHGKPSLISEEDGPTSAELADYRSTSRTSENEKNPANVGWSAMDGYHSEHIERR